MPKRLIIWVNHVSRGEWVVKAGGLITGPWPKKEAISAAVRSAKAMWADHGSPCSVKIRLPDGTIHEERTFPRSSDPRRSRG